MPTFRLSPEDEAKLLGNAASVKITHARPLGPVVPPDDAKDEKQFQADVWKEFKRCGWAKKYHTHNSRKSDAGFPDLVIGRRGQIIVAELKVGDNKPSEDQVEWLNLFKLAGIPTYLWYPADFADVVAVASSFGPCPFSKQWEVRAT